jgi:hypothetical protein
MLNTKNYVMNEQIPQQIVEYARMQKPFEAYKALDKAQPHPDWVVELPSKSNPKEKYKTLKLETMESLMKSLFGYAELTSISSPIFVQDKNGRFSVTVTVIYSFMGFENQVRTLPGIATVYAHDISMLELATPKASSMAVKNAIKQLGGLFGKYLNKSEDIEELPTTEKVLTPEEEKECVTEGLVAAKTLQDLKSWRHLVYGRNGTAEQQSLYETKLRQIQN